MASIKGFGGSPSPANCISSTLGRRPPKTKSRASLQRKELAVSFNPFS